MKYFQNSTLIGFAFIILNSMTMKANKRIMFFGDSITEMGVRPGGYIEKMRVMFDKRGPSQYDLIGAGIGGNKVYDLYLRMDDDVLSKS